MSERTGVVLLNLGGPADQSAIRPFLTRLFSDREIIRLPGGRIGQWLIGRAIVLARLSAVKENYRRIGGGSPIHEITRRQAEGLETRLAARGLDAVVRIAMRYSPPFAADALADLEASGAARILALTLYPQYSRATTGSSMADLARALARRESAPPLTAIDRWATLSGYLDAMADRVRRGLMGYPAADRKRVVLLFSAHSLPISFVQAGDAYVGEIEATVAGIRERLPPGNPWRLAWQSRVGPVKWVGPGVEEVLAELAGEGRRNVLAIPVSFVGDHVETLYEVDLLFGERAKELGIEGFRRIESLNDDPAFLDALADLVERRLR